MSVTLPVHFRERAHQRAWTLATQAVGLFCVFIAGGFLVGSEAASGEDRPDLGAVATLSLLVIGVLIVLLEGRPARAPIFLALGAVCVFAYSFAVLVLAAGYRTTDLRIFGVVTLALVVPAAGLTTRAALIGCTAALVSGQFALAVAAAVAGREYRLDSLPLVIWLLLVGCVIFQEVAQRRGSRFESANRRAARVDEVAALRLELQQAGVARLHDTALSELQAIAAGRPGPLDPRLRSRIRADLRQLDSDEWLTGHDLVDQGCATPGASTGEGPFAAAITVARDDGLSVAVSGEPDLVHRLSVRAQSAVAGAVAQCLSNVLRHGGVLDAEVSVGSASPDALLVLVIDAGAGFDVATIPSDRLGLRESVAGRIAGVGGTVRIFSRPGSGTSVSMTVPFSSRAPLPTACTDEDPA